MLQYRLGQFSVPTNKLLPWRQRHYHKSFSTNVCLL